MNNETSQPQPAPVEPAPASHHFVATIIAVVILVLAIGGGTAYAYFNGYFVSPDAIVAQAITSASTVKSATADAMIVVDPSKLDLSSGPAAQFAPLFNQNITTEFSGSYDIGDPKNIKMAGTITVSSGFGHATLDMRIVDNVLYVDLTSLTSDVPGFSSAMLVPYENKWFSLDYYAKSLSLPGSANPQLGTGLTQEQRAHISDLAIQSHVIKVTGRLPDEAIDGQLSYHFTFDIDHAGLVAYLQSVVSYMKSINPAAANNPAFSMYDASTLNQALAMVKDFNGEFWIGHSDGLAHKTSVNITVAVPDTQGSGSNPGELGVSVVSTVTGVNQPVTVEAPADSTSFQELMTLSTQNAQANGTDARVKADLYGLRPAGEIYYEKASSYSGFCSSSDAKAVSNDIQNSIPPASMACAATSKAWAASAGLNAGGYFCVDSAGDASVVKTALVGTACPKQ